ncbi:carbohydrate sulfotransferase 11-like [Haliotis rubra]|uniref:carbohydrate sulfotransferase 11-like n=1 Tax=Haliotis rubra TaxID=36100 RepID=UPI001EE614E7|nr:carbohydrate sulfotransferase 11-like [Haliotis rubra]
MTSPLSPSVYGYTVLTVACLVGCTIYGYISQNYLPLGPVMGINIQEREALGSSSVHQEVMDPLKGEYEARLQRYRDACAVRRIKASVYNKMYYYADPGSNTSIGYCPVPKVGCTFWRRIFMFLNRTQTQMSSPFDISRFEVYFKPMVQLRTTKHTTDILEHAHRFLFVRDPYSRLFSAYVDKFLLPQFLSWPTYGKVIAAIRAGRRVLNETCVTELVTFPEFVNITMLRKYPNIHWLPITSICDPCRLHPDFIGQQESFSKDAKYILNKVGLGYLLTKYSHKTFVSDEITQVVDFTFAYGDYNRHLRQCYDSLMLAERLWTAFKMNGYILPAVEFPKEELLELIQKTNDTITFKALLTQMIVKENGRRHLSPEMFRLQKKIMMLNEYKKLSRETMDKIAKYYTSDFKLFGYEQYPETLFPWRYAYQQRSP